jgi:hypothetical protein
VDVIMSGAESGNAAVHIMLAAGGAMLLGDGACRRTSLGRMKLAWQNAAMVDLIEP